MISDRLRALQSEIASVAIRCGRSPSDISLIAVTKYASPPSILEAYNAGHRAFAESRIPTALEKISQLPSDIAWHFIGRLQSNKVSKAIGRFALIHSVDTPELAADIAARSRAQNLTTSILLQVNTSSEPSKQGFTPDACRQHIDTLRSLQGISIQGLMTMAPLTPDTDRIRACFSALRTLRDELRLQHLSMGMSHDYPIAIEEGATLLRIGSAIFGP